MVTLRTPRTSAAKEISLLTSSHFLSRWTSPQGSTKYLKGMGTRERVVLWRRTTTLVVPPNYTNQLACHFRVMTTSNYCWFSSLFNSPTDISSQGSYNVAMFPGLVQAQHLGTTLQSHLFGTNADCVVGGEVKRRVTKREFMVWVRWGCFFIGCSIGGGFGCPSMYSCIYIIYRILKQMTGFCWLLFAPYSVLEVTPLDCIDWVMSVSKFV